MEGLPRVLGLLSMEGSNARKVVHDGRRRWFGGFGGEKRKRKIVEGYGQRFWMIRTWKYLSML